MHRPFCRFFCLIFALLLFGGALCASAEGGAFYYAKIDDDGLSAYYDSYTKQVEFAVDFKGSIFEDRGFKAALYRGDKLLCEKDFNCGKSLVPPTRFEGTIDLAGGYSAGIVLRVKGEKLDVEGKLGTFYTMDDAECPLLPKPEPAGAFFALGANCIPQSISKGGTLVLSLFPRDIDRFLSGGLRQAGFTLIYDKALLSFLEAEMKAESSDALLEKAAETEGGLELLISSESGLKRDKDAVLKLYFRALKAGDVRFSVRGITGRDVSPRLYENKAGYALSAAATISERQSLSGDINRDGEVDNLDAALVLRYDAGIDDHIENGDVNGDGETDNLDAAEILRYDAGIISGFGG